MNENKLPVFSPDTKKVIFFDMNRTLVDPEKSFDRALAAVIQEFTGRLDDGGDKIAAEDMVAAYKKQWAKKKKMNTSRQSLQIECLRQTLKPYDFDLSDAFLKKMLREIKRKQSEQVQAFPDVKDTLVELSHTYTLAVISNSPREKQIANLKKLGLDGLIPSQRVFTPETAGCRKPNPLLFRHALKTVGVTAANAVMVGNSWKHDIFGATRSAIDAVWVKRSGAKKISHRKIGREKIWMVRDIKQLLQIFE
jgi:HAD superfamily hydrolase (TIGR01549 family)